MRPAIRFAALAAFAIVFCASTGAATPRCEKPCKAETAACIRDRCTGLAGEARHACIETCRGIGGCAAIRTLAYIWNECRSDARGIMLRRELRIRRGNCAPVTVRTIGPAEPVPTRCISTSSMVPPAMGTRPPSLVASNASPPPPTALASCSR